MTTTPSVIAKSSLVRQCGECGKDFQPYRSKIDRYCSLRCQQDNWSENHVRVHKSDMAEAFGKDWQARLEAARAKRKARH